MPQITKSAEEKMLDILIDAGKGYLFSLSERKIIFEAMQEFADQSQPGEGEWEVGSFNKYCLPIAVRRRNSEGLQYYPTFYAGNKEDAESLKSLLNGQSRQMEREGEAVEFAEWIRIEGFYLGWNHELNQSVWTSRKHDFKSFTTPDLYNKYLNEKQGR